MDRRTFMIRFSPGDALRRDCRCGDTWREVALRGFH
jgi:hypothetical protein